MAECNEKEFDVKVLSLKRWNFPQTDQIFNAESGREEFEYGEYVSYKSHHFIDIESTKNNCSIPAAYDEIVDVRRKIRNSELSRSIHVIQNITLLGEKTNFWNKKGNVLYITFIQLVSCSMQNYNQVESYINQVMNQFGVGSDEWAWYYSLDFCDIVLFMRDIPYKKTQDILWRLAVIRDERCAIIRDSFTITCLHCHFLRESFLDIEKGIPVDWEESMKISMELSIQDMDIWRKFHGLLCGFNLPIQVERISGRYDIRISTEELNGNQILQLLYCLDQAVDSDPEKAFGGYEISLLTDPWSDNMVSSFGSKSDTEMVESASSMMKELCKLYYHEAEKKDNISVDYVAETKGTLEALLKNGFSEEFVLSILQSFYAYLKISLHSMRKMETENPEKISESLSYMTRSYFSVLNTLSHCTMHAERRFIQAQAFNAIYFDVPPKLLAFYSAIAYECTQCLTEKKGHFYNFILSPDYRKDIHVIPLEINLKQDPHEHLAIMYINERFFYNPSVAIKLICHEIGHYAGERKRKKRAGYIFKVVSMQIICYTKLSEVIDDSNLFLEEKTILSIFADGLSEYLMSCYEREQNPARGIPYHLTDISRFLERCLYGLAYFDSSQCRKAIIQIWKKKLQLKSEDRIIKKDIRICLEQIDYTLNTNYLSCLNQSENSEVFDDTIHDVLLRRIYSMISDSKDELNGSDERIVGIVHKEFCESIIQAFSEAFADLQMAEVIGDCFDKEEYYSLFDIIGEKENIQKETRQHSLLHVLQEEALKTASNKSVKELMKGYATRQIVLYLNECVNREHRSETITRALRTFKSGNVLEQYEEIHSDIISYRENLTILFNETKEQISSK